MKPAFHLPRFLTRVKIDSIQAAQFIFGRVSLYKGHFLRAMLIGLIISVTVTVLARLGYFKPYQNPLTNLLHFIAYQKAEDVVLLFITEGEYQQGFKGISPLSRERLAEAVNLMVRLRAKVIALDIDIADPTSEDPRLAEAIGRASAAGIPFVAVGNLKTIREAAPGRAESLSDLRPYTEEILVTIEDEFILFDNASPGSQWLDKVLYGGVSFRLDDDGVFRKAEALYMVTDPRSENRKGYDPVPSFPVAVTAAYQGLSPKALIDALRNMQNLKLTLPGKRTPGGQDIDIPIGKGGRIIPNFIGNYENFHREVNLGRLLEEYRSREPEGLTIFRDKIVIIGGAFDRKDFYMTPVGRMSGMEILANITQSIISGNLITPTSFWKAFAIQVTLGIAVAGIFILFSRFWATLICLLALVPGVAAASLLSFSSSHYWFDFVPTIAGVMIYGWVIKTEEILKRMKGKLETQRAR
jgi:CHASE2 domain-containing sensor protein